MSKPEIGSIGWIDLTAENAAELRDFYCKVVGWKSEDVPVADYHDYCVAPVGGEAVAGICHARGASANLPAQWMIYITVADVDQSIADCESLRGKVVSPPRDMGGYGRVCVIQDPAGAVAALIQPPA